MTIDKPPKVAKISNGKLCPRCHYKNHRLRFFHVNHVTRYHYCVIHAE